MYLFRVSRPLICKIIPEVCACIIEALKEHVKVSTRLLVVTKYQGRLVALVTNVSTVSTEKAERTHEQQ
nr:unnamed protein product [Callosobruchus chinensis]